MTDNRHLLHIGAPEGVAPAPVGGYSQVVAGSGRVVMVAGQVAFDPQGELVGKGDIIAQASQVFENLRGCLAAAGATFDDVVKLNVYVTDIGLLDAVRSIRSRYIKTDRPPASTAVQVVALAAPDFLVEIDAMAIVGK